MWNFAGAWRSPSLSLGPALSNEKRTVMTINLEAAEESKTAESKVVAVG